MPHRGMDTAHRTNDRCLWTEPMHVGSNFPIEKLWTDYGRLVSVVLASLSRYDAAEQNAVLHDTAASLYRL
jgi:predicted TIM-barrel fold metal-dependent hydrolase